MRRAEYNGEAAPEPAVLGVGPRTTLSAISSPCWRGVRDLTARVRCRTGRALSSGLQNWSLPGTAVKPRSEAPKKAHL